MAKITPARKLHGITKPFEGNGRKFGYPTANIKVNTTLDEGVYFGFANLDEYSDHAALIFIGTPTTVGSVTHRVEAYLLDITDEDYYNKQLQLTLHHFHRPNHHFGSIKELLKAIKSDEIAAREWFSGQKQERL